MAKVGKRVKGTALTAEYDDLCKRVEAIDAEAAELLRGEEIQALDSFSFTGRLRAAFIWKDSSQGHAYWDRISEALGERPLYE